MSESEKIEAMAYCRAVLKYHLGFAPKATDFTELIVDYTDTLTTYRFTLNRTAKYEIYDSAKPAVNEAKITLRSGREVVL